MQKHINNAIDTGNPVMTGIKAPVKLQGFYNFKWCDVVEKDGFIMIVPPKNFR